MAKPFPVIRPDTSAAQAARLFCERGLPGLIVVDDDQHPLAVLSGPRILWSLVPGYVRYPPVLARFVERQYTDQFGARLGDRSVRDLLDGEKDSCELVVPADAQAMEIAALMAKAGSALVAVVEPGRRGRMAGAVTVADLFDWLLPAPAVPG